MPNGISTSTAADIALCMSELPQDTRWNKSLGHSGGLPPQGSQAKTRACRGSIPVDTHTHTQHTSTPLLQRLAAVQGFEQNYFGSYTQRSADHEFIKQAAGTCRQCYDLQRSTTTSHNRHHQHPSLHLKVVCHKCRQDPAHWGHHLQARLAFMTNLLQRSDFLLLSLLHHRRKQVQSLPLPALLFSRSRSCHRARDNRADVDVHEIGKFINPTMPNNIDCGVTPYAVRGERHAAHELSVTLSASAHTDLPLHGKGHVPTARPTTASQVTKQPGPQQIPTACPSTAERREDACLDSASQLGVKWHAKHYPC